jgi:hypothetical protein
MREKSMIAAEPKTRAEREPEEGAPKRRRGRAARNGAAVLTAAFGLALAQPAAAQSEPTIDRARMAADMRTYFGGEKGAGPLFFGAGLTGVGGGTLMALKGSDIVQGVGFPLIGIGLVQGIVGATLLLRTDEQVAELDAQLATDPAAFKRDESKRIDGVKTSLYALMILESVLIMGGAATAVVAAQKNCCRTLQGVGLGLAAQSAVTLMLDLFALARAREYADSLRRFEPPASAAPSPGGAAPMSRGPNIGPISFGGRF